MCHLHGVSITVVVSAYNVETYIRDCLESLHEQTLQESQFVVVDDGSTDGTGVICEHYASIDSRFKILRNERNEGTLLARKNGCELASGTWLTFLDGDDVLANPGILSDIVSWLERYPHVDILQLGFVYEGGTEKKRREMDDWLGVKGHKEEDGSIAITRKCFERNEVSWCVCGKVFKADKVKQALPFIPDIYMICAEDCLMYFLFCIFSSSFRTWGRNAYVYRLGTGVSTSAVSMEKFAEYAREPLVADLLSKALEDLGVLHRYCEILVCLKMQLTRTQIFRMSCLDGEWSKAFSMLSSNADCNMLANACASIFKGRQKLFLEKTQSLFKAPDSPAGIVFQSILRLFMEEGDRGADAQKKLAIQTRELQTAQAELKSIEHSVSFRTGRAVTWLPRKVRDCMKSLKEHGMSDTLHRCFAKVSRFLR